MAVVLSLIHLDSYLFGADDIAVIPRSGLWRRVCIDTIVVHTIVAFVASRYRCLLLQHLPWYQCKISDFVP